MEIGKKFTPPGFQVKKFTLSISPNFNILVRKNTKNGEIYTAGNKFYTATGTDGMDKFHLCHF